MWTLVGTPPGGEWAPWRSLDAQLILNRTQMPLPPADSPVQPYRGGEGVWMPFPPPRMSEETLSFIRYLIRKSPAPFTVGQRHPPPTFSPNLFILRLAMLRDFIMKGSQSKLTLSGGN